MKIRFERKLKDNPMTLLRRCGYKPWRDPRSGKEAFIKRLSAAFYPRFHIFGIYEGDKLVFDLHLDSRRPMHRKGVRSFEDEESPVVRQEADRIREVIEKI